MRLVDFNSSDPQHVGGAWRAEGDAGGNDDPIVFQCEAICNCKVAGLSDHVLKIARIAGVD